MAEQAAQIHFEPAPIERAPRESSARKMAIDYLRTFIIVLVLVHHSFPAYVRFGQFNRVHYLWSTAPIVDAQRWVGFDLIVVCNDIFFMSLMFFVSGLFVWPSLRRKGTGAFPRDRLLRLSLPFVGEGIDRVIERAGA